MSAWETVNEELDALTQRLKIPGGWIYHLSIRERGYASTFFVPEPDKCSYHDEYLVKGCYTCQRPKPFNRDDSLNKLKKIFDEKYAEVMANREEILSAFIAKYGMQPDDIMQVEKRKSENETIWYVQKKDWDEIPKELLEEIKINQGCKL